MPGMGDEILMTMQHAAQPALHSMGLSSLLCRIFAASFWSCIQCIRREKEVNLCYEFYLTRYTHTMK
jgi:hypothetical protein